MMFANQIEEIEIIKTGTFLDKMTGIGGLPRGRIVEIFGDEGLGKTTVCLQAIANAQKNGVRCLLIDLEWSFDVRYAESLGVDLSKLGIIRERFAEDVLDQLETEVETGKWDLIVLDSIGGILPKAEAEKSAEGKTIGGQAKLVAVFCRKIVPLLVIHNACLVTINHAFTDIMSGKIMTSGGKKLAYHKAMSIRLKNKFGLNTIKQGDRKVGKVVVAEVWGKNKVGSTEGMQIEAQILFGSGFSQEANLLDDALSAGIVTKVKNSYFYGKVKLGTGKLASIKTIEASPELLEEIKSKI